MVIAELRQDRVKLFIRWVPLWIYLLFFACTVQIIFLTFGGVNFFVQFAYLFAMLSTIFAIYLANKLTALRSALLSGGACGLKFDGEFLVFISKEYFATPIADIGFVEFSRRRVLFRRVIHMWFLGADKAPLGELTTYLLDIGEADLRVKIRELIPHAVIK